MSKINPASYLLGALAVCDEHRAEVLEFGNILQERDWDWGDAGTEALGVLITHETLPMQTTITRVGKRLRWLWDRHLLDKGEH